RGRKMRNAEKLSLTILGHSRRRARPRWQRSSRAGGGNCVQLKPTTEVEATAILPSLNVKTARWWRGIVLYAPRAGGVYDSHHRTAEIAGRTRRRGGRVAARGARAAAGQAVADRLHHTSTAEHL